MLFLLGFCFCSSSCFWDMPIWAGCQCLPKRVWLSSTSAGFLIGDNNRNRLAEPYHPRLNDSANEERSTRPSDAFSSKRCDGGAPRGYPSDRYAAAPVVRGSV